MLRARAALALAAACTSAGVRHPEAIGRCSPQTGTARMVISTQLEACDLAGSPQQPHLDLLSVEGQWLSGIGGDAEVAVLRAHGCPTAVLCTDSNAWAALLESAPSDELDRLVREARARARPPPAGVARTDR